MSRYGNPIHLDTERARSGETSHVVRYVLAIGLVLAILALSAVWISGALTAPQGSHTAAVSNQQTPRT